MATRWGWPIGDRMGGKPPILFLDVIVGNRSRSYWDAAGFSLMVGLGESYLGACVIALGFDGVTTGLFLSVPVMVGGSLQLASMRGLRAAGTYKKWVVGAVVAQALALLIFAGAALGWKVGVLGAFAASAVYWGAGMSAGPAWNLWIERLVRPEVRVRFFARRIRIYQAGLLASFLASGWFLSVAKERGWVLGAFAAMFGVASLARLFSACCLWSQDDLAIERKISTVGWREIVDELKDAGHGRFILVMLGMQATVQIAGPYYTPFMLRELAMPYEDYALIVAIAIMARIVSLPFVERLVHRYGAGRVLFWGAFGIAPQAAAWAFSQDMIFLACVQVVSGVVWGAYEMACTILVIERLDRRVRGEVLGWYNFSQSVVVALSGTLGGMYLRSHGEARAAYLALFLTSSILRLLPILLVRDEAFGKRRRAEAIAEEAPLREAA